MTTTKNATDARQAIQDLAASIECGTQRNTLRFQYLSHAQEAANLFQVAGLPCHWMGTNQPILTTAADFAPKNIAGDW